MAIIRSLHLTILAAAIAAATVLGGCKPEGPSASRSEASPMLQDASASAKQKGQPALWTIRKAKGDIRLFGSVHVLPKGERWQTLELQRAMDEADAVVLEVPFREAQSPAMQAYVREHAILLTQPPLSKLGSPEEQASFAEAARRAGLEPYLLDQLRPWFASITMAMSLLTNAGYDPNSGVDQFMEREALRRGKEMLYFESAREQIDFFVTLPERVQVQMLRDTVEEINTNPNMIHDLVEAWRTGDIENLGRLANESYSSPELEKVILTDRNKRWVKRIKSWLEDEKNYLIVVGAGHLAGESSVINLLREDGVKVEGP